MDGKRQPCVMQLGETIATTLIKMGGGQREERRSGEGEVEEEQQRRGGGVSLTVSCGL